MSDSVTTSNGRTERRAGKSATAFRTISEVATELDLPQHVLRFWEGKFGQIRPMKRGGGRRYYRPEDVALLKRIRDLLHNDGYTIKGVQKLLREGKPADQNGELIESQAEPAPIPTDSPMEPVANNAKVEHQKELQALLVKLEALRDLADSVLEDRH